MLGHEAGFFSACSDIKQLQGMARYTSQTQGGSQDLTATFTIAAIKLNSVHMDIISLAHIIHATMEVSFKKF
jgi:hypothetical protein